MAMYKEAMATCLAFQLAFTFIAGLPALYSSEAVSGPRITGVEYPEIIEVISKLYVTISILNPQNIEIRTQAAIYDLDDNLILASIRLFLPPLKTVSHTFELKAPYYIKIWHLLAWTRCWCANTWIEDPDWARVPFNITVVQSKHDTSLISKAQVRFNSESVRAEGGTKRLPGGPRYQRGSSSELVVGRPQVVKFRDTNWYLWEKDGSDTCLIWLGGGLVEQYRLLVNPFWLESIHTIRYLQDVIGYYCLLALQEGNEAVWQPQAARIVKLYAYRLGDTIIRGIFNWLRSRGYNHIILVGYSVGGAVAVKEAILDPHRWTSPNSLVLMTALLNDVDVARARFLKSNLLQIYGDTESLHLAEIGAAFYEKAPNEGPKDGYWYHKEYHLLKGAEHEVMTNAITGEYDPRASSFTVAFIERVRALALRDLVPKINSALAGKQCPYQAQDGEAGDRLSLLFVQTPNSVKQAKVFTLSATVSYSFTKLARLIAVSHNFSRPIFEASSWVYAQGEGKANLSLLLTAHASFMSAMNVSLILFFDHEDGEPKGIIYRCITIRIADQAAQPPLLKLNTLYTNPGIYIAQDVTNRSFVKIKSVWPPPSKDSRSCGFGSPRPL